MGRCHSCGREVKVQDTPGRQEICPHCRNDLHCCLNCNLYDEYAQNKCREPAAEGVSDRVKNNFCDFFSFKESTAGGRGRREREEALAKLEALIQEEAILKGVKKNPENFWQYPGAEALSVQEDLIPLPPESPSPAGHHP